MDHKMDSALLFIEFSIIDLLRFNTLKSQMIVVITNKPSLHNYRMLHDLHWDTLQCPCSESVISYDKFVALVPTFHPVFTSDLVSDPWIALLFKMRFSQSANTGWLNEASRFFQYLSELCQLSKCSG